MGKLDGGGAWPLGGVSVPRSPRLYCLDIEKEGIPPYENSRNEPKKSFRINKSVWNEPNICAHFGETRTQEVI